jgi:pimeloyl-ACP methyl ester carboxylesterase
LLWVLSTRPFSSKGRINVDDISIFFHRYGKGEPVILLHGGFAFSEMLAGQIPALARRYQVITMDSRGHGRTTLGDLPLNYRQLAADTAGLIEKLGLGPVHLVGWSDGGCAGLALALERPDLLRSLVLTGTPFNTSNYSIEAQREIARFLRPRSIMLLTLRAFHRFLNPEPSSWKQFLERMTRMWNELPDFTTEELGRIEAPVLVIGCDRDEFLSPAGDPLHVFKETAEAIPNARLEVIPGGTHSVQMDKARTFNRLVLEFLESVRA